MVTEGAKMELRVDQSKNIVYIRLTGPLSKKIILEAFDAAVSDQRYKKGMGRLWDFRKADLSALDSGTIEEMAKYPMKFPPGVNNVKVAFVATRELEYGLSRIFQAHSREGKTSVSVFYTMEEAEAWLSE